MSAPLGSILNWRVWSDKITLSGQPTDAELSALADQGVTHIVNLGPHWNKGALPDEPASVARVGMHYIYIPVEFDVPTQANFDAFNHAMIDLADSKVHVHCIYNARVSAFMYKRAKLLADRENDAFQLMDSIWRPGTVWSDFLDIAPTANGENQYAGYEY